MPQVVSLSRAPLDRIWPLAAPTSTARALRSLSLAIFGSLALWASAKLQVPFWPVPMTLQTGAVLFVGVAYGWRLGLATVLLYLAEGALGLPVLAGTPAKGIGIAYMTGPTGGYLVGFLVAVAIAGALSARTKGAVSLAFGLLLASLAVFACGAAWLAGFVGWTKAVQVGVLPFILGDVVKILLVVTLAEHFLVRRRRP